MTSEFKSILACNGLDLEKQILLDEDNGNVVDIDGIPEGQKWRYINMRKSQYYVHANSLPPPPGKNSTFDTRVEMEEFIDKLTDAWLKLQRHAFTVSVNS